jgi:hypothetical protein
VKSVKIGIGTANPQSRLSLKGDGENISISGSSTDNIGAITFDSNGFPNRKLIFRGIDGFDFYTGTDWSINKLRINSSGNVGMGTLAPEDPLTIKKQTSPTYTTTAWQDSELLLQTSGNTNGEFSSIRFNNPASNRETCIGVVQESTNGLGALYIKGYAYTVGYKEYLRVTSNGNVGIGTTNPGVKLDIAGGYGRVEAGYSWLTNSDERLKKNIKELSGSLVKVLNLRGVSFDLMSDTYVVVESKKHIGFIAQELEVEFPELVVTDDNGTKAIAYDKITAILVEAIKDQQKLIEDLKKDIDLLKTK